MKRIKYFVLRNIASLIIWYLHRGGFTIIGPNDAAVIFREGSVTHEAYFPWHLAPDEIPEGEDIPMPDYLTAALVVMFALGKSWIMQFLHYYLYNEGEVDGDVEEYKRQVFDAIQAEQAQAAAGQPESKATLH